MEEMFNNYGDAAKKKVKYGLSKTLLLAILAGAFIAIAAAASTYASNFITNKSLAKIISGLIFLKSGAKLINVYWFNFSCFV